MYIHENRLVFLERPSNAPSAKTEKVPEKKDTAKKDAADKNANVLVDTKTVKVNPAEVAKKNGYEEVGEYAEDGLAIARDDDLFFLVDSEGKSQSGTYFEIKEYSDGMRWASGEDNNQWILLGEKGKEVNGKMYEDCRQFSEGLCGVQEGGKWHFIDKRGNDLQIGEFKNFDDVYDFHHGVTAVRNAAYWKLIKKDGSRLNDKNYTKVADDFEDGTADAQRGGVWYTVDLQGNENKDVDQKTLRD